MVVERFLGIPLDEFDGTFDGIWTWNGFNSLFFCDWDWDGAPAVLCVIQPPFGVGPGGEPEQLNLCFIGDQPSNLDADGTIDETTLVL